MTPDAVDDFLAHWAEVRPDLDVSPMGPVGRLSRSSRLVERGIKDYFASVGMEPWEFDVLATLRRIGPPYTLTPKDLVATTMVGSPAVTNRVDRLVARNFVTRQTDPENRRRLLISLTAEGLALVDNVVEGHVARERELLSGLSEKELEQFNGLLRKLLLSLDDRWGGL
ncbi:MarR family transcriptional regulator [Streptomyces sp. NPDC007084]|uniref:MarR family winged helix-turn-helix transcriptional regulator n=1 Tax=Streptomyces sp. NPDC007084 TaxID=3154313 RepID=UPI0034521A5A